jgi:hypothetical protein
MNQQQGRTVAADDEGDLATEETNRTVSEPVWNLTERPLGAGMHEGSLVICRPARPEALASAAVRFPIECRDHRMNREEEMVDYRATIGDQIICWVSLSVPMTFIS